MQEMKDDALLVGDTVALRTLVADRLRFAIVTGLFRPGSQLRERELCERTGVSRPSLREALRQLEAEGLITSTPRRGPVVTALTEEEVGHLYALRQVLESFAAQEFARRRKPDDIEALQEAVRRLREIDDNMSPFEVLELGTQFYRAISKGSGNPYLAESLTMLHNRIALIRFISLHQKTRSDSIATLCSLSEPIIAGDAESAGRGFTEYLQGIGVSAKAVVAAGYRLPEEGVASALAS